MTFVTHINPQTGTLQYFPVCGVNAKHVAQLIANATNQEAIWTGKARGEWHITDKRSRKITAVVWTKG